MSRRRGLALAALALAVSLLDRGALLAQPCQLPNREATVDRCLTQQGCVWNRTQSLCEPTGARQTHNGDERFVLNEIEKEIMRERDGVVSPTSNRITSDRLGRQCTNSVLSYLKRYAISVSPTNHLEPANGYLTWPQMSRERKLRLRRAWLSLRRDGTCRQALEADRLPNQLRLSGQAQKNWELAERGNPFNGLIDCRNWKIYLIPQALRLQHPGQKNWTLFQLRRVRWAGGGPRLFKNPSDIGTFRTNSHDHGRAAELVSRMVDFPQTFQGECQRERELKSHFLGFFVWPDSVTGAPVWQFSSRQLNGANLDAFRMVGLGPGGRITAATRLVDAAGQDVLAANGDYIHPTAVQGELTPGLGAALQALPIKPRPPERSIIRLPW